MLILSGKGDKAPDIRISLPDIDRCIPLTSLLPKEDVEMQERALEC